ncbi:MBL fold metallo-hydrolase [Pseudomonas sp. MMS21-TM103]|uniref:MBL fold metallo-hydrolase n=1 Tax=Pseudomonas sp. MMS21 TM103 TaxID=2886506 RepID=UPI001EDF8917|nr:MBL fold metallo-hydrolase [Pseudomonas sp. MMS21 TM103]MCG4451862.1 MBL fold metallo-hydrolase [Pseudomonas sp. MMS21 TM103]
MTISVNEADKVEILTLQDNYIDLVSGDSTEILKRALPVKGSEIKNSVLAEHGFSALVTIFTGARTHRILFDFGFSEHGAAFNVDALDVDLKEVETLVLSHGHIDHFGGMRQLVEKVGRKDIKLVVHPAAFRHPRYIKFTEEIRINFPPFTREAVKDMGVSLLEKSGPHLLADGFILFLGEIPRTSDFERGMPNAFYEDQGEAKHDSIEDDTAIVANVKGQGLVILSGCAHSGIINTVRYAQEVTGIEKVFVVMGGFHLTGPDYASIINTTTDALKDISPRYIVPTHCTGRNAVMHIEQEMNREFLLNMAGTKLTFSA